MWPSRDPDKKMCDGGIEICEVSKTGNLRFWYCNYDKERRNINGKGLSFPDFLLAEYGKSQTRALVWDNGYVEWCDVSPSSEVSSQESNKLRPRDYSFREWTLIKVRNTNISEPVKRSTWEFNLEIDKLDDEYELGIGKKGHILDNIWEYYNQVYNKNYEWHDYEFENEESEEIGIEDKDYHPPEVQVETFEVKKYSFERGQSFICVTKDLDNILPLGRKNRSKFKEMIRKEVENNKTIQKLRGNYLDRLDSKSYGNHAESASVMGVNHQNKLTHPHPQRNFVPTVVATKSGLVQVNAAKQSSPRAAASISTARHISTVSIKPKVNAASPIKYYYFKAHSPLRRPFNQKSVAKTNNFNKKVYTAKVNNVTIAGPEIVVSTAERKRENAVESSACWIWRPSGKVIDHISKDSGSYMPKRFDYVDPQGILKKISVLFTATDFMLYLVTLRYWIESQVLLNVPRQNNMYSFVLIILCLREIHYYLLHQNRVLVTKPHNKTPYELLLGRPPSISFMRPFGCPVTILNTLDPLGKFDGKAFRVFNTRTRKVEENLHINFLENKPNVARSGPEWLFDIDSLTKSMNYKPVTIGNQTNGDAGIETNVNVGQAGQEKASDHEYILLPLMLSNSPLSSSSQSTDNKDADEVPGKGDDDLSERNGFDNVDDQERIDSSTQDVNTVRPSINTASENINTRSSNINTASPIPNDPSMQSCYIKKQRETKSQRLSKTAYLLVFSLTIQKPNGIQALTDPSWIEAIQEELLQFILQKLECESTFLYGTIEEEVYACQPPGFKDPQFPDKVYKEEGTIDKLCSSRRTEMMHKRFQMSSIGELTFFLGLQVQQKEDRIFISQDKYVADILKKFDFTTVKEASTPIETNKALLKDEEAEGYGWIHHLTWKLSLIVIMLELALTGNLQQEMRLSIRSGKTEWKGLPLLLLEAEGDSGNINRTKSMATLNESFPQGTNSGSGPGCQDTILGGAEAQIGLRLHLSSPMIHLSQESTHLEVGRTT
ncbi:retrovirus-related pol polyprotein from transposon TNT 1-94 [Tanacetum coccineum]|uniref:Retrovirus-related pol polyprotein from transposon TNT 1-94 n=1 Tax=Tanacetum coccineum TaxID=301880 RepID=A0ABQ5IN97_9ASTR